MQGVLSPAFWWLQIGHKLVKRQWRHNLLIWPHLHFFFNVAVFLLSSLVTGPSFRSISWLFPELWQFLFVKNWPEIQKSEISASEFYPISGDWSELGIPNLVQISVIKSYWLMQNARFIAFTISESLSENQQGKGGD